MKKNRILIIMLFLVFHLNNDVLSASQLLSPKQNELSDIGYKTSVIIPCCALHAHHLYPLLKLYEEQTELPDEVIISSGSCRQVPDSLIDELKNKQWRFPVTLFLSEKTLFAGANRNIGCSHAIGDIFICQDADDIPHPQRIEIIKYFFRTYKIDCLGHQYILVQQNMPYIFEHYNNMGEIESLYVNESHNTHLTLFTNGNIAIARHVFDKIQWSSTMSRSQDTAFNQIAYKNFQHCLNVKAKLIVYRQFLSSVNKKNPLDVMRSFIPHNEMVHNKNEKFYLLKIIKLDNSDRRCKVPLLQGIGLRELRYT
jgi:glycosyltransferase involved in cell wall biosynthesis